jgi:hypothetical protein
MEAMIRLKEGLSHTVRLPHMSTEFTVEAGKPQTVTDKILIEHLQNRPQFAVSVIQVDEISEAEERHPLPGEVRRTPARKPE